MMRSRPLLAGRELGEKRFVEAAALLFHVAFAGFVKHALDELLEGGLLEGLFNEVDGAALEGVHGHGHVAVAVMKMMGRSALRARKVLMHLQARSMPGMRTSSTRTARPSDRTWR